MNIALDHFSPVHYPEDAEYNQPVLSYDPNDPSSVSAFQHALQMKFGMKQPPVICSGRSVSWLDRLSNFADQLFKPTLN